MIKMAPMATPSNLMLFKRIPFDLFRVSIRAQGCSPGAA